MPEGHVAMSAGDDAVGNLEGGVSLGGLGGVLLAEGIVETNDKGAEVEVVISSGGGGK
jgi:hypothetical protein